MDLRLTLFAARCYSRRVPIGRGFSVKRPTAGIVQAHSPGWAHHNQTTPPAVRQAGPASRHQRGITLFDETTAHNSESNSTVMTEEPKTEQQHQPEQNQAAATAEHSTDTHGGSTADDKIAAGEDFASVLETFTTE